jgi:hypothetical protein
MANKVSRWRLDQMAESEWDPRHALLVKAVIVLTVFPILLSAFMWMWKLVLLPLAWVLPPEPLWARLIGLSAVLVGLAFALFAALWLCRPIWPKSKAKSPA